VPGRKPWSLKSHHRLGMRKSQRRRASQRCRDAVLAAKDRPCHDCGVRYPPWVMDFDHRPGTVKVVNLSRVHKQAAMRQTLDEIAKCDVVCSNCHRQRTHSRNQYSTTPGIQTIGV